MQHKTDIRDHTNHVLTVALVQFHRLVVTGSEQQFRSSTFTEQLLFLIECIEDGHGVLLQHQFIEQG